MERVAITVWQDRISPVFESCSQYLVVDCSRQKICRQVRHDCSGCDQLGRILILVEQKVTVLLCGAITVTQVNILQAHGIQIIPFRAGTIENVLKAYLLGKLESSSYSLPGCPRRIQRRFRGGR